MRVVNPANLFPDEEAIGSQDDKNENEGIYKDDPTKDNVGSEGYLVVSKHGTDDRDTEEDTPYDGESVLVKVHLVVRSRKIWVILHRFNAF